MKKLLSFADFQLVSKVIVFFHLLLISISVGRSQVSVIENDPYQTSLILQLKLFDLECGTSDMIRYSVGFRGDYFFPKIASLNASWHQAVYSTLISSDAKIMENENENLAQFRMLEAGFRIHLSDKEGSFKSEGFLKKRGAYNYYAILRDIPVRKIFSLRGGAFLNRSPVSSNWSTLDNGFVGGIVERDGTIIGKYTELFTNMRTSGFYGGISWCQFANTKYQSHNKTWVSKFFKETYFDIFYSPTVAFESFIAKDPFTGLSREYEIEPNMEGSFRTANIGWRIGVYRVRSKQKINITLGLEAGSRPGIAFRGLYFSSSIALSFST